MYYITGAKKADVFAVKHKFLLSMYTLWGKG